MTDTVRKNAQSFADWMAKLPREEVERINALNRKEAEAQQGNHHGVSGYVASAAVRSRILMWRGRAVTGCSYRKVCARITSSRFSSRYRLRYIENYLRWVASEEAFAKNINDLADEGSGKLLELTIKYKNLKWSFSCGESDLNGHEGGAEALAVSRIFISKCMSMASRSFGTTTTMSR